MRRILAFVAITTIIVALSAAGTGASESAGWAIVDLGTAGGAGSRATDINERGQVVGSIDTRLAGETPSRRAFLWSNSRMRDLGTLPLGGGGDMPNSSEAVAVNDRGQVIGTSRVERNGPQPHAFLWFQGKMRDLGCGAIAPARCELGSVPRAIDERGTVVGKLGGIPEDVGDRAVSWLSGKARRLGTLPGRMASAAVAIDGRGRVVGNSYSLGSEAFYPVRLRAWIWQNGKLRDLGALPGDRETEVVAMNRRGQVIGLSYAKRFPARYDEGRGFVWQNGTMRSLGSLQPVAINDRGQIVAFRPAELDTAEAVLWENGRVRELGAGWGWLLRVDINDRGQVVGTRLAEDGNTHGFVWQDGTLTDLGTLPGGRHSSAVALNERGQIVGRSTTSTGTTHAILWQPV